jgi:hypothetical protein
MQDTNRQSIIDFIESLKGSKSFEAHRNSVRIVPKGFFIDERGVDAVVSAYQGYIHAVSQGAADKSADKTKQWLFEGGSPQRFYLVEGKNVLAGFLAPVEISNPQRYGLPFYLGSLLPTSDYLHPADPELTRIHGVSARQGASGVEIIIKRRDGELIIPQTTLKEFVRIAQGSAFLRRRYQGCDQSLVEALKGLVALLRRARYVPRAFPMVVPHNVLNSKTKRLRVAGKFIFIEEKRAVIKVYELHARHLSDFLRRELLNAPREKLGTFKLTPKHRDLMGFYEARGRRTSIHARAFAEFCELTRRSREPRERLPGWITSADCFERFASLFQLSQPISRHSIAASLERFGIEGHSFRISGGWIFVLSRDNVVMRTVARHIRLPGHQRKRMSANG